MAPPKVSVTKKQPLEDVGALEQKVGGKAFTSGLYANKVDPSFVGCQQTTTSCQRGRYRKPIIIGLALTFLTLIICVTVVCVVIFVIDKRHGQKPPGPGDVFQMGLSSSDDVQYDDNRQRINVTMKGRPTATFAYADFGKGVAVFKDDVNKQCYVVRPLLENYLRAKTRWQTFQGFRPFPRCPPLQVQGLIDPATLDPEVAQQCEDYLVLQASFQIPINPPQGDGPMGDGPMGDGPMGDGPMGDGPMGDGPMWDEHHHHPDMHMEKK
ncbi:uncharacterized protein LOC112567192 [Pomacea canaliculata]|uniref:uncharacterized protein LOC112567192 n=1 Tax=Pomacea canaliculata TaxID=400727 RepID=UPI000D72AC67|nr:uncharacterized protein LOC112567192 [Pomacea canaliculata]